MKKIISTLFIFIGVISFLPAKATTFNVQKGDIFEGYIIKKIWLSEFAVPQVTISDILYSGNVLLPKDAVTGNPAKFTVSIGMERKRPFAVVRIPAFVAGSDAGIINQVIAYSLSWSEGISATANGKAKFNNVTSSVLATGTWYKIGVVNTGFYKIDQSVLSAMGLKPADVNPANVRVFGNGGGMLSEDNRVSRPSDLLENGVLVNANGDNVFDNDESVVFYAQGSTKWTNDSANQLFHHLINLYSDTAYYFVSVNSGASKRLQTQSAVPAANTNVTSYNYYNFHEKELVNPVDLGKLWYGEQFNSSLGTMSQAFSFDAGSTIADMYCTVSFASTSDKTCSFYVTLNGNDAGSANFASATKDPIVMNIASVSQSVACNSRTANVVINFNSPDGGSMGYLDYIELNGRAQLVVNGDQMNFRDWQSVGAGNVAAYQLQGANSNTRVWDVTDAQSPVLMTGSLSGSTYSFSVDASVLHEFAVMNGGTLPVPKYIGTVANQNLHASGQADLLIVTYPGFSSQAKQLADYHASHDHLRVVVATTTEIYNEFSSGAQDISAIRDFAKMFYDRAGTDTTKMPRYLLLFGGASYDYKNRVANNSNFVPVFESLESTNNLESFSTDDFFGFLDNNENIEDNSRLNALDLGVGRLPARSVEDANDLVSKVVNYANPATLGPWRISTSIVADKGCQDPAGDHMQDAESMAGTVAASGSNIYNEEKIYVDAIPIISTPAGERCPNANAALNEQIYNGTFLINYNGHGNPEVWSSERILTQEDYNKWNNVNMLPFMVTATCDFGQFDHPQFKSSAEQLVLRKNGGVIAILTTTQAVYAYYNHELNVQYLNAQFTRNADLSWNTFGEASRRGKNATYILSSKSDEIANFRKFSLLGDPAVTPDFPQYGVKIDSIIDGFTLQHADTVKALGAYIIDGSVRDNNGNVMTGFNGLLYVSFFDKPRNITTISGCSSVYSVQNNLVYKGRVSVINGKFSFTFITPKDLNYSFGNGKISMYATNDIIDAAGADVDEVVGGFSDHPVLNTEPPVVKAYINDSMFLNGGITGANTSLYVSLYDKTGINVSGTDIGHDLTAVIDGNIDAPYILNNYYETEPNTYQRGYVSFGLNNLADGPHSIKVKAWDINDNVGEGSVNFVVVDGKVVDIEQLGNYPNPFSNSTHFIFEHNHPDELLDVQIAIYNTSGALVKNIQQSFTPSGSRTADITWDGADNGGNRLPSGVYVYRLNIATDKGYKSSAYQKLVIVR